MVKYKDTPILVGADPEAFGVDTSGNIISMIGKIGGSKDNPLAVTHGALQEDNILAEFNIDPTDNAKDFISNIKSVVEAMHYRIHPYRLDFKSHATFEPEFFKAAGPKAMEFGCDPDYNAWTGMVNDSPNPESNMRTAAGHVHVGFKKEDELDSFKAALMMDFYIGLPSVILDKEGAARRAMYGKAGACRPKEYGVEYRVPSNFWLKSDELMEWVFNSATAAVQNIDDAIDLRNQYMDIVPGIINNSDVKGAKSILKEVGINYG